MNDIPHVKIVLLGESGVGKSCLMNRFVKGIYTENIDPTISVSSGTKIVDIDNNKKLKFDIWDTAGQERFRSIAQYFYRGANIVLLLYEITNKNSFDAIKDYWYDEVKNNGEKNVIIAIVGTKSDLFNEQEVDEEEVKKYSEEVGGYFYLTSSKEGQGVNKLFQDMGKLYLMPEFQKKLKEAKTKGKIKVEVEDINKPKPKKKCCN